MKDNRKDNKKKVSGSATIEASLLVPLVLAILFLLLQTILYLHDHVVAEAWLYRQSWQLRWEKEQDMEIFQEEEAPAMAILRGAQVSQIQKGNLLRQEVLFQVHLLPSIVEMVWAEMPQETEIRSLEQCYEPWEFLRLSGAILEEWEETMR